MDLTSAHAEVSSMNEQEMVLENGPKNDPLVNEIPENIKKELTGDEKFGNNNNVDSVKPENLTGKDRKIKELLKTDAERLRKEQWYKHLQLLLNRSQFYSTILAKKIEAQKKETLKMQAKALEMQKQAELSKLQESKDAEEPLTKRRRAKKILSDEEIEDQAPILNNIQESMSVPKRQPATFQGEMRGYQLDGLDWLKTLYQNGINGILADEMGLGKTIQVIALIAHLYELNPSPGPFLICAPLSTLGNWQNEFKRFAPHIQTVLYHASKKERPKLIPSITKAKVVITSYEIIMQDRAPLSRKRWRYIVVDEGHRMKNPDCRFVRDLKTFTAENRLLLTGTPLQNNLIELWSLLNFLMPDLFDDLNVFQSWFKIESMESNSANAEIIAMEREKHIIDTLHQILTPFLLRRTKAEVDLNLPPKKEILIYARMSGLEERFYKATLDRSISRLLGVEKEEEHTELVNPDGSRKKRKCQRDVDYSIYDLMPDEDSLSFALSDSGAENSVDFSLSDIPVDKKVTTVTNLKLKNIIMHLKKIVTHPYLVEYPLTPNGEYLVDEKLVSNSGKLRVLDCLFKELKRDGHKVVLFSQMTSMLDILHDYCVYRGYRFCRLDGHMSMDVRDENIKAFNDEEDIFIFLISTRAGGLGLNLVAADTVVIYDSDWNPQCDLQAQDRCHRYGQTKPVMVYRLVTGSSIDEKIVSRANAKRKLEKMIMMQGRFSGKQTEKPKKARDNIVSQLEDLLNSTNNQGVVLPQDGEVFTKEQLSLLLDRSGNFQLDLPELGRCFKVINQIAEINEETI